MDYRLELKVKNNKILKKLEEKGYKSVYDFCLRNGKKNHSGVVSQLINLKDKAINHKKEYRTIVLWMCESLKCTPDDLFTPYQKECVLETNVRTVEMEEAEAIFALANNEIPLLPDEFLEQKEDAKKVERILKTLSAREELILRKRFGLDDGQTYSLKEIGDVIGVNTERVRQLEAKALRKLRHNSRSKIFGRKFVKQT